MMRFVHAAAAASVQFQCWLCRHHVIRALESIKQRRIDE